MKEIVISIAAYNDAPQIEALVQDSLKVLEQISPNHGVFIVNDGSKDDTSAVLKKIKEKYPKVEVFEHLVNMGFGTTMREIYTLPDSEFVFILPGDGQIPAAELLKLYPRRHDAPFILGWRRHRNDPFMRRFNSWGYNMAISLLAGRRVHDVNSVGLLKRSALEPRNLQSMSAFIHAEIFLEVIRGKHPVLEIEIHHKPRVHGSGSGNKWRTISTTVKDMIKYALKS